MNTHEYMRRWFITEAIDKHGQGVVFAYSVYWALLDIKFVLDEWRMVRDSRYTEEAKEFHRITQQAFLPLLKWTTDLILPLYGSHIEDYKESPEDWVRGEGHLPKPKYLLNQFFLYQNDKFLYIGLKQLHDNTVVDMTSSVLRSASEVLGEAGKFMLPEDLARFLDINIQGEEWSRKLQDKRLAVINQVVDATGVDELDLIDEIEEKVWRDVEGEMLRVMNDNPDLVRKYLKSLEMTDSKYEDIANIWDLYNTVYALAMASNLLKGDGTKAEETLFKVWKPVSSSNTSVLKSLGLSPADFEKSRIAIPSADDATLEKLIEAYQFLPSEAVMKLPAKFGQLGWE